MIAKLKRLSNNGKASVSIFYIDYKPQCFIIEDEPREEKLAKETRLPATDCFIGLRLEGGQNERYGKKFSDFHKGMLCIYNKPGWILEAKGMSFKYSQIHPGNTEFDTESCLLPNFTASLKTHSGSNSVEAYKHIYVPIANEIIRTGKDVPLIIEDE